MSSIISMFVYILSHSAFTEWLHVFYFAQERTHAENMLLLKFKCLLIKKIHMLVCIKTPAFSYMFSTSRQLWSSWSLFNIRQTDGRMDGRTFGWTGGRADGRAGGRSVRRTDVPTLHIVSYFAGTDAFMSLHKLIITLFITPKNPVMTLPTVFMQQINP